MPSSPSSCPRPTSSCRRRFAPSIRRCFRSCFPPCAIGRGYPLLAQHFLQLCRVKLNRSNLIFGESALARLAQYDWPGNIRELQNVIERAAILAPTHIVEIDERVAISYPTRAAVTEQPITLHDSESLHIRRVLEQVGWRIYGPLGAANRLGINPSTLRSRMKKLGLLRPTSLVPIDQLAPYIPRSWRTIPSSYERPRAIAPRTWMSRS